MSKNKTSTSVSMSTTNIFLFPWIVKQIFAGLLFTKLKWDNRENDSIKDLNCCCYCTRHFILQKILSMISVSHFCKKSCPWHQCHIFAKNPVHDISFLFLQKTLSMTSVSHFCKKDLSMISVSHYCKNGECFFALSLVISLYISIFCLSSLSSLPPSFAFLVFLHQLKKHKR